MPINPEDSFRRAGKHSQDTLEQAEQRRVNAATSRANRHAIRAGGEAEPLPLDIAPTPSLEEPTRVLLPQPEIHRENSSCVVDSADVVQEGQPLGSDY